ncbi:hypothetical protein IMZ31_06965 [Pontibacillus sp. ALD_SL1]|uniref:hypothetical protein n=1 Tax=Pontibacillus sp. ALD_SL1 TaxID=2777185 RepID=UPI001A96FE59|nr:hypothetical protein [Pontibacillus sp. ALD_SL1]QST01294.1 hypothetical protein IMZ31_06965 [Pontibacillus sp. ALD_SL1]
MKEMLRVGVCFMFLSVMILFPFKKTVLSAVDIMDLTNESAVHDESTTIAIADLLKYLP